MASQTSLPAWRRRWVLPVTLALAAAALTTGIVPGIPAPAARADEVTASQNDLRDGWDQGETGLTPTVLGSGTFGQLFSTQVDGQVYAQPVVAGTPAYNPSTSTVYLVSQEVPPGNSVYSPEFFMHSINAQTGAERPGWPVPIHGAPANDPGRLFNPFTELQRPGLLLLRRFGIRRVRLALRLLAVRRVRGRGQHQQPGPHPVE